jgi:hypothetical protein
MTAASNTTAPTAPAAIMVMLGVLGGSTYSVVIMGSAAQHGSEVQVSCNALMTSTDG